MLERIKVAFAFLRLQPRRLVALGVFLAASVLVTALVVSLVVGFVAKKDEQAPPPPVTAPVASIPDDVVPGPGEQSVELEPGVLRVSSPDGSVTLGASSGPSAPGVTPPAQLAVRGSDAALRLESSLLAELSVTLVPLDGQEVAAPVGISGSTLDLSGLPPGGYQLGFAGPEGVFELYVLIV